MANERDLIAINTFWVELRIGFLKLSVRKKDVRILINRDLKLAKLCAEAVKKTNKA